MKKKNHCIVKQNKTMKLFPLAIAIILTVVVIGIIVYGVVSDSPAKAKATTTASNENGNGVVENGNSGNQLALNSPESDAARLVDPNLGGDVMVSAHGGD